VAGIIKSAAIEYNAGSLRECHRLWTLYDGCGRGRIRISAGLQCTPSAGAGSPDQDVIAGTPHFALLRAGR